jgi:transcriptional regulator with XRE-family HTH domain
MSSKFLPELLNFQRAKRSVVPMDPDDFRKIRKAAGLTQGAMAERIGVTRLTICNWEGAKYRIPDDILDTLAQKGLGPAPIARTDTKLFKATVDAYRQMRRDGISHASIKKLWLERAFTPSPEAKAAILVEFPDILNNGELK